MRAQARRASHEEEEESAFVSMTDMTVGFLFIMMILLAFFASQFREQDTVPRSKYEIVVDQRDQLREEVRELKSKIELQQNTIKEQKDRIEKLETENKELKDQLKKLKKVDPLEEYLARVAQTRRDVLTRLRDAIKRDFPDLAVELSEESDALRFQGEGLFTSGSSSLAPEKRRIVARLAQRLDELLPCYTIGSVSQFSEECNPAYVMIEAVQIEGHTDNLGDDPLNRNLSAARANDTFFSMSDAASSLKKHQNLKEQPVLSVAAYGPDRPVASNNTSAGRATNRRIDLRFIMVTPRDSKGISRIREALAKLSKDPE